jgi:hypothetical protein
MTTIAEDAAVLRQLKETASNLDATAKAAKAEADQFEARFFERMEAEGIGSIKVGGTNFVPVGTVYGQVQDREKFIEWAQANSPELLELKERKALVNEIVREAIDAGTEMPDGLGFYVKQYVSQRVA